MNRFESIYCYKKRKGVSESGWESDAYLIGASELIGVLHAADGLTFADVLHACYKHMASLVFRLRLVKFEHGGDHTARFGCALEQMGLEHILTVELGIAVFALEGSTG